MVRLLLEYGLPLATPTILYLAWMAWRARRGLPPPGPTPWTWLGLSGAVLAAGAAFFYDDAHRGRPGDVYAPSRVEDGKLVPGKIERP